jgi:TRAP-type C4-dicarboxylate transport system substrate-binding protein
MKFGVIILAGALSAGLVTSAAAQDKPVALKISHWVPASHPLQKPLEEWAESLKQATGGTVTSTIFPAQQLGKAFDHYNMARDGIADVAHINPGYEPGRFPIVAAADLPFMLTNGKEGSRAVNEWYRRYAEREMKDVKFCMLIMVDPGTFHTRTKKIMVPTDVAGMKIRPASATVGAFITLLGGTNVQGSAAETRELLEKGVADGLTFQWGSLVLFGVDKVTKYHMNSPFYSANSSFVMNKAVYDGMSPSQKKAVDEHCTTDWSVKLATAWADFESAGLDKVRAEPGQEIYDLDASQVAAWRAAAAPLQKSWAESVKKVGGDPDAIFKDLTDSLAKYNSLVK